MQSTPPPSAPADEIPPPNAPSGGGGLDNDDPPWRTWTAPAAVVLGLAVGIFGGLIVAVIGQGGGSSVGHPTPAVALIGDVVFDLAFVGAALYFASMQGRPRPADFGFRRVRPRVAVLAIVLAGVSYYGLTAVYAALFHLHGKDKLPSELGSRHNVAAMVGAALFVCVIAPMAEEFFFRGFFFGALKRWHGPWVAAVITGLLFGLAHTGSASSQYLIPLGFLGFVLCLVRWRTGSLYPCMALHSLNNALALGVNQLQWNAVEIIGLMLGSLAVIAAVTGPLAGRGTRAMGAPGAHLSTP
jgi:membrane protease YdiL (CAAX protease family)